MKRKRKKFSLKLNFNIYAVVLLRIAAFFYSTRNHQKQRNFTIFIIFLIFKRAFLMFNSGRSPPFQIDSYSENQLERNTKYAFSKKI